KQAELVIIDDSASESALRRPWSDGIEKDLSICEFLEALKDLPFTPFIFICCSEKTSTDGLLFYNELGANLILKRPFGSKELSERIQEAAEKIKNPTGELKLMQGLMAMVHKGEYATATTALEKL